MVGMAIQIVGEGHKSKYGDSGLRQAQARMTAVDGRSLWVVDLLPIFSYLCLDGFGCFYVLFAGEEVVDDRGDDEAEDHGDDQTADDGDGERLEHL